MDNEERWQVVGRLVRERRERLGLKQGDLANYGGPAVSTVGKIERGVQENFPTRTRHQIENSLGWKQGTITELLAAQGDEWWADRQQRAGYEDLLVNAPAPDLAHPIEPNAPVRRAADLSDDELLAELTYRMKRYADQGGDHERDTTATRRAGGSPADSTIERQLREALAQDPDLSAQRIDEIVIDVMRAPATAVIDPGVPGSTRRGDEEPDPGEPAPSGRAGSGTDRA